jgi:hypothetical protein
MVRVHIAASSPRTRKILELSTVALKERLSAVGPEHSAEVSGKYKCGGRWNPFASYSCPLPKNCDLLFKAKTNVPTPFEVYWQVVNTGEQAQSANHLRGEIMRAKTAGVGGLSQKEATRYSGMHWIECFIIRDGTCEARSGEFVVNIE